MDQDIYNTLYYYHEQGDEGYDLAEVMLLEDISDHERIDKLINLLNNEDKYIAYQASLILISWNIKDGFEKFNQFYENEWDKVEEFEPHSVYGSDNFYDIFADAFANSLFKGNTEEELIPYIKKLLFIYGEVFFESCLKNLFLDNGYLNFLVFEIEDAMNNALNNKKPYQASQLFPVLVKIENKKYDTYIKIIQSQIENDSRIKFNIDEAKNLLTK